METRLRIDVKSREFNRLRPSMTNEIKCVKCGNKEDKVDIVVGYICPKCGGLMKVKRKEKDD